VRTFFVNLQGNSLLLLDPNPRRVSGSLHSCTTWIICTRYVAFTYCIKKGYEILNSFVLQRRELYLTVFLIMCVFFLLQTIIGTFFVLFLLDNVVLNMPLLLFIVLYYFFF
jgi:hypothetical protein